MIGPNQDGVGGTTKKRVTGAFPARGDRPDTDMNPIVPWCKMGSTTGLCTKSQNGLWIGPVRSYALTRTARLF